MRNINERLLLLLQRILVRHAGTNAAQAFADVNQRVAAAVADLFPDGAGSVSIDAFRQVEDACRDGIEMAGADSLDAQDYREVLSAVRDITKAQ